MKLLMCVLGLACIAGAFGRMVQIELCEDSYCYKEGSDCLMANDVEQGELVAYNAPPGSEHTECHCMCGKPNGANCTTGAECVEGFECVITKSHAQNTVGRVETGLCRSKCERMTGELDVSQGGCTPYQKCVLEGRDALCKLRKYKCKSGMQGMEVEALRVVNNQQMRERFESPCVLHETNRELQQLNPASSLYVALN